MKQLLLFCLLLFVSEHSVHAQATLKWGPINTKVAVKSDNYKIVGVDDNITYGLKVPVLTSSFTMEKYDGNNNLIVSKEMKPPMAKPVGNYPGHFGMEAFMMHNKNILYCYFTAKMSGMTHYVAMVDKDMNFTGKYVEVNSTTENSSFAGHWVISPDRSKLVFLMLEPKDASLKVKVFNGNMEQIAEANPKLNPSLGKFFDLEELYVSNDGSVYVITKQQLKDNLELNNNANNFSLFVINKGTVRNLSFPGYDHALTSMRLSMPATDKVACAGFYSDEGLYVSAKGTYFIPVDINTMKAGNAVFHEFEPDVKVKLVEKEKDMENEVYFLGADHAFDMPDGSKVLVGEIVREGDQEFNYNQIYVAKFDAQGKIKWQYVIPKIQRTDGTFMYRTDSYLPYVEGDKLHIFFNGFVEADFKSTTSREGSGLVMVTIDDSGKREKYIAKNDISELIPVVRQIYHTGSGKFKVLGRNVGKNLAIGDLVVQ